VVPNTRKTLKSPSGYDMIKPLRKRHLQIWAAFVVLLPLVIIFGRLAVPVPARSSLLQPSSVVALPLVLGTKENTDYLVNLRSSNDTSNLQLEWINKTTLTVPSAVIYKLSSTGIKDANDKELVGRIEARGAYHFALKKDNDVLNPSFLLYDFIHQKNIDTLNF
jgi:hypothetical protein